MTKEIAVILLGGEGKRMQSITKYFPKCCLPIYDEPLLIKQLKWLIDIKVKKVFLIINIKSNNMITQIIRSSGLEKLIEIVIICENEVKGIAFSLINLKDIIDNDPSYIKKIQNANINPINIGVVKYESIENICEGCNLLLNEKKGEVLKFIEKPFVNMISSKWCWNGVAVLNQYFIQCLSENLNNKNVIDSYSNNVFIETFNEIIKSGIRVTYCKDEGHNININHMNDYYHAFVIEREKYEYKGNESSLHNMPFIRNW